MLAVTTPTGTGDAIHDSVLLHPLFGHSHVIHGRIVSHEQLAQMAAATQLPSSGRGPAIGSGAGASAAAADAIAISPIVPWHDLQFDLPDMAPYAPASLLRPRGLSFAPPDPPPTTRSAAYR
jgi:hypothetical protein